MQPPEPPPSGTSLELTFGASTASPAPASTDVERLPPDPPSQALTETTPAETAEPIAPGLLGNLVVAHFRQVDTAMLGRVLVTALSGALPASMIRLERRRSLSRRLARRADDPIGITVTVGDRMLSFRAPEDGVVEASAGHVVRGVVLSSTPIPVAAWLDELGELLDQLSCDDEATRQALERTLLS